MRKRIIRLLLGLVVLGILLGGGAPALFVRSAHAATGSRAALSRPLVATAPSPSGAVDAYPRNDTFDAAIQPAGTPPTNAGFETASVAVGTPPQNSSFAAASTVAGTPPTNSSFSTGDLSGWTAGGSPTPPVLTDPTYGHYANLSGSATLTSSPFTVDPSAQVLTFNAYYQAVNGAWINVYVLSGSGYSTKTQIDSPICYCGATWRSETADLSNYRGQTVELEFAAYFGTVGVTAITPLVALPNWTTKGAVSRALDSQQNPYAALNGGTITSSAFTLDPSAQMASLRVYGLSSSPQYRVFLLSGSGYTTSTSVALGYGTQNAWTTVSFPVGSWAGQSVELQVQQITSYNVGVDDVGLQQQAVPGWTPSPSSSGGATLSEVTPGSSGSGQALQLQTGTVTSSPFTLGSTAQQLSLQYKSSSQTSTFSATLLSGTNYTTSTILTDHLQADPTQWKTLQAAVQSFAGQSVELQLTQNSGTGLYDNAGIAQQVLPGWTLTSTNAVSTGSDASGDYVTPFNSTLDLQSVPVNPGIVSGGMAGYHYYTIGYNIGFSTGNLLQVTFVNTSNQSYQVFQAAANSPTGYVQAWFYLADFMGTQGTLNVHLAGGGKVYSLGDNAARQALAEPFSQKVGLQVDTSTGAFGFQDHDLGTAGGPLPLDFTRYYTGQSGRTTSLGYRWSGTYDTRLGFDGSGDGVVDWGSGREEFFAYSSNTGVFTPADARVHDGLVKNGDGTYTLTTTSNLIYHFTSTGQLTSIADLHGIAITLAYNGSQQLTTVTDPGGRTLSFAYNPNGTLLSVTDPTGAKVSYGYNSTTGDLNQVTDPLGHTRSYSYDAAHHLLSVTDQTGQTQFTNTLDSVNRVVTQTDSQGKTISLAYSTPSAGVTQVTDPNGNAAQYYFDQSHRTTAKVDPKGNVLSYVFDISGNLQKVVDPANNTWSFAYDSSGTPSSVTDPLNQAMSIASNPQHLPTTVTDGRGHTTTNTYDGQANLSTTKDPLGNVTSFTYDTRGNQLSKTDPLNHTWTYTYDALNNKTSETDPLGNVWQWTYDPNGKLVTATDPDGNVTTTFYDADGRLISTQDGAGNLTSNIYDPTGHLLQVTDPLQHTTSYAYDARGLGITKTDQAGKVWSYGYDSNRNTTSVKDPLGNTTTYSYDQTNRLTGITDPLGHTTSYGYDSAGRLLTTTAPNGGVTTNNYDANGNLTSVKDARGSTTTYVYDADNRRVSMTDALGHTTSYVYDAAGRQTQVTDALNHTTVSAYDAANRLTSVTDPTNAVTSYGYDKAGNRLSVTDPASRVTTSAYDADNRVVSVTDPLGTITTTTFDADGRVTAAKQPSGATTTNAYDPRGLLLSVTDSLNHVTSYSYDDAGRQVTETDPNSHTTTTAYNADGTVASITDALSGVVHFGYDAAGQQTSLTDARGKTTSTTYDASGDVLTQTDPLNRKTTNQYDLAGNLTQTTDARGVVTSYGYDAAGNQTQESYPGGGSVTWAYDALGRRSSMTDVTGTTSWGYDAASRVTSVAAPQGGVSYSYNLDGSRASMTLPGGKTVGYAYDGDGRLSTVSDWLSRSISLSYTVDGLQAGITRPDGVVTTNSYDSADRLTGVSHTGPGSTALRHFTYTLDAAGNRTAVVSDAGTESYTLDPLNRLTNVSYPQGDTASYSYDPSGNRLTKTTTQGGTTTYSYDDADQLLSDGTTSYSYDQNGNLLGAGSSVFSWDYANRLATAQVGSTTASYSYDGDGTRTSKTVEGTTTPYVWDRQAGMPLLASDGTTSYLSDTSGNLLGQLDSSNTPTYYLDDGLGSVRGTAGTAGTLAGSADYDVFGAARNTSGVQPGAGVGFTGQQTDAETGFQYLRARDFNPSTGRFLSADSVIPNGPGTQGYNLYAYVANNPTSWADPSGQGIPTFWITLLGPYAIIPACGSTSWCRELVRKVTEAYAAALEIAGECGVCAALSTLAYSASLVYIAVACAIDVTAGPDHADHCFYVSGASPSGPGPSPGPPGPVPGPPPTPTPPPSPTPPGGCQYGGGGLKYAIGNPSKGQYHVELRHRRHATPVQGRQQPQGVFASDSWSYIWGVITVGDKYDTSWSAQGSECVLEHQFPREIGYDDPPEAASHPAGSTGDPTRCIRIVIVNQAAPAEVITAYPIAC
jgi:RHS repeat-associated protein